MGKFFTSTALPVASHFGWQQRKTNFKTFQMQLPSDSMAPQFVAGQVVTVVASRALPFGSTAIVYTPKGFLAARVLFGPSGGLLLQPLNPDFQEELWKPSEVIPIGFLDRRK